MRILTLLICLLTTQIHANTWQRAYPRFDFTQSQEYKGYAFAHSYVEYRLIDGHILEINLHDQMARNGYFFDRLINSWFSTRHEPLTLKTGPKVIWRTLTVVSGLTINTPAHIGYWVFKPNFQLIDQILETSTCEQHKIDIVTKFKEKFPNIDTIRYWIGFGETNFKHPFALQEVKIDENFDSWITMFQSQGIEFQPNHHNEHD